MAWLYFCLYRKECSSGSTSYYWVGSYILRTKAALRPLQLEETKNELERTVVTAAWRSFLSTLLSQRPKRQKQATRCRNARTLTPPAYVPVLGLWIDTPRLENDSFRIVRELYLLATHNN